MWSVISYQLSVNRYQLPAYTLSVRYRRPKMPIQYSEYIDEENICETELFIEQSFYFHSACLPSQISSEAMGPISNVIFWLANKALFFFDKAYQQHFFPYLKR